MQDNQKNITSAIIIAGLIIAGAVLLKDSQPPTTNNQNSAVFAGRAVAANSDHILGNPNAPIVVVEYSDFECPFCKTFHNTMHRVVNDNNGKVAWVFRQYPIPQLHSKAFKEAEATECAFEQGGNDAFWKYADKIFEVTPSNNRLDEKELPKIAGEIGLNVASFNECLASGKYQAKVQADIDDGVKVGVNGTPSSLSRK
jgi:protein-disulfide isomerase